MRFLYGLAEAILFGITQRENWETHTIENGLPLEGFLATAFREVVTLDLRHLKDRSSVDVIDAFQPDMVSLCTILMS